MEVTSIQSSLARSCRQPATPITFDLWISKLHTWIGVTCFLVDDLNSQNDHNTCHKWRICNATKLMSRDPSCIKLAAQETNLAAKIFRITKAIFFSCKMCLFESLSLAKINHHHSDTPLSKPVLPSIYQISNCAGLKVCTEYFYRHLFWKYTITSFCHKNSITCKF